MKIIFLVVGGGGGGKMGNNFLLKQLFLRGNFGDQVLGERFW